MDSIVVVCLYKLAIQFSMVTVFDNSRLKFFMNQRVD